MIVPVTSHYKNNLFTIQRGKNTFVLYRIKFRRQFAAQLKHGVLEMSAGMYGANGQVCSSLVSKKGLQFSSCKPFFCCYFLSWRIQNYFRLNAL